MSSQDGFLQTAHDHVGSMQRGGDAAYIACFGHPPVVSEYLWNAYSDELRDWEKIDFLRALNFSKEARPAESSDGF